MVHCKNLFAGIVAIFGGGGRFSEMHCKGQVITIFSISFVADYWCIDCMRAAAVSFAVARVNSFAVGRVNTLQLEESTYINQQLTDTSTACGLPQFPPRACAARPCGARPVAL